MNFCLRFLRLSVFPWGKDSLQIVMLWWERLGRLKWHTTGLDASELFCSASSRSSRKRSASLLPVFACGYSGVRVVAFFEKLAHFLAFAVKVGVVTSEASQSEKLREQDGIFYMLWMRGRM